MEEREREGRLLYLGREPLNAETALSEQVGIITPNAAFYKRNHFPIPGINAATWRLTVDGEVKRPLSLSLDDILSLPSRSMMVTMECAGNGRSTLDPAVAGEVWREGAVSTAEWTGVPLRIVLEMATLRETAREILAEGADGGHVVDAGGNIRYARSLPPQRAMHPDTLLAYAMNGEPLPPEHGFPLRLVVPGWYGMASVKWITRIAAIRHPFDGFYQVDRYVLVDQTTGDKTPLKEMRVRALITSPRQGSRVPLGLQRIRGLAWSGSAPIEGVDVSTDGGETWRAAEMLGREEPYAWRRWEIAWEAARPGPVTLLCRAHDAAGNQQPDRSEWNILGYCANAVQRVDLTIV